MLKKLMGCLLLACVPSISLAAAASEQLISILTSFQSMAADFSQTVYDSYNRPLQQSTGNMILHRPGNFRWEVKQPTHQLFVTDGKTLWTYDIDLEQATEQQLDGSTQISPAQLLTGSPDALAENFTIVTTSTNPQTFRLTPKQESDMFEWVELTFVKGRLDHMTLLDTLSQQTRLNFTNLILNPRLKDDLFKFTPPKGVDVIRDVDD